MIEIPTIQPIERVNMTQRIDQVRRRIAAIEQMIGINGVDFQTTLEREIARQANVRPAQNVPEVQNTPGVNQPVNENDAANSARVAQALREAERAQNNPAPNNPAPVNPTEPAQNYLPGEEALPERINPSQQTPPNQNQPQQTPTQPAMPQIERVEVPDTVPETPNRDDKIFEDNYIGRNAEITPTEDLIMQTAYEYGVSPQTVKGIVEYINQRQSESAQVDKPFSMPNETSSTVEELISWAANEYGVDPQLVRAIAIAESDMNQDEISPVGAIGVMQLMPETAAGLGVDPYSTSENVAGGTRYLRQMLDTFDGDVPLAVAAYNAGPAAVQRYGGIPPYSETRNYVGRVMDMYR